MSESKINVYIDEDLEDLIPGFLANRADDIKKLKAFTQENDFDSISRLGHSIKGVGGGYGFDKISDIGLKLEHAAEQENNKLVKSLMEDYESYLANINIIYQ